VRSRTLEPEPVAFVRKVFVREDLGVNGILGSTHEVIGPISLRHYEVFQNVSLTGWTRELLGAESSAEQEAGKDVFHGNLAKILRDCNTENGCKLCGKRE
jgi:hypothetical protein